MSKINSYTKKLKITSRVRPQFLIYVYIFEQTYRKQEREYGKKSHPVLIKCLGKRKMDDLYFTLKVFLYF